MQDRVALGTGERRGRVSTPAPPRARSELRVEDLPTLTLHPAGVGGASLSLHPSSTGIERVYTEAPDVTWRVTEHRLGDCGYLVFMSAGAMRRVRRFPAEWWRLSNAELATLSWTR
jgi:hypothetical protein